MAYNNLFSIPVSRKRQASIRRKFIIFSSVLFLLIFIGGSAAFVFLMRQILHDSAGNELVQVVKIGDYGLESYVGGEIAIVRKMAASPLIQQHLLHPEDAGFAEIALEDIEGYRQTFMSKSVFWISNADKRFHMDSADNYYVLDPNDSANYWYNMTMYETPAYNFNINYNPNLNVTNLWINAPVFDRNHKPVGMLGTGINLSDFVNTLNEKFSGEADLYFFNAIGEITWARDVEIVANKITLEKQLGQTGTKILDGVRHLKEGEVKFFETHGGKGVSAFCKIPLLGWNVVAIHNFTIKDTMQTGMTFLFGVMMLIIFFIVVVVNIFASILLEPLNRLIKTLNQISGEWDLMPQGGVGQKDEMSTLGEFLNMTIIDSLTGIYNRRYLNGSLKKFIKSLSRSNGKLSLLLIDVDFFKRYNDKHGHDAGDICLKTVANAIAGCAAREQDFAARYGGEEFVVVLPNTDEAGAGLVAEKILRKICECRIPHGISDVSEYVTVSIGGTTGVVKHHSDDRDFIKRADEALFHSKHCGRNRYTFKGLDVDNRFDSER